MARYKTRRRCVKPQRSPQERTSHPHPTDSFGALLSDSGYLFIWNSALQVRSGNHSQRTIVFTAGVQMESNRDHLFEYKNGRLNMEDIGLDGPGSETLYLNFLLNRDSDILVPRNLPVGVG